MKRIKTKDMLKITNLCASVEDKQILRGINLEVRAGEVHAINMTLMFIVNKISKKISEDEISLF